MPKTYPAVLLMSTQGRHIALAAGIAVAVLAVAGFAAQLFAALGLAVGLVAAVVVWAGVRLVAELVEVVAETLLPR